MNSVPDLFELNPTNACVMYSRLRVPANSKAQRVRDYCEHLWRTYCYYAEPQFRAEFPLHFHDRWFEMYLTVSLLQRGAQLQRTMPPGPDLLVNVNGHRVWIEAVCSGGGEKGLPDSIPKPYFSVSGEPVSSGFVPWDQIALRIRSSVEEKRRRYDSYLAKGIVTTDDSLLIAVNIHEIPYASSDAERYVFRSLFGIGNQVVMIDRATAQAVSSTHEQLQAIPKLSTGAPVGTQSFTDGSMPTIAGVIVSSHGAIARANENSADLTLYPNLTATRPWTTGSLLLEREWEFQQTRDGWVGRLLVR